MAIDKDTQDVIDATAKANAAAFVEALNAANGRGKAPAQTEEIDVLDAQGQPTGEKITVSRLTGKPPKNSMQIYQEQQAAALARRPAQATPDYDNDPVWGTQKGQTDDPALSAQAKAHRSQTAPTPPADPYKSTSTLLPDPVSGQIPPIPPRDPWSAKWVITGASGLVAESTDSATIAANIWNSLVTSYQKP